MSEQLSSFALRQQVDAVEQEMIEFAQDLVRIRSVTGHEEEIARFVADRMRQLDYDEVEIDEYGSAVGRIGEGEKKIIFDGHIDTVAVNDVMEWAVDPYVGHVIDGRLYGRGSSDMKAAVAAAVYAGYLMKKLGLLEGKTVYISASTLEEDYDGEALYAICQRLQPQLAIICEPSNNRVVLGQQGRAVIRIDVPGVSAHGSAPEKGVNAVYAAIPILQRIEARAQELIARKGASGSLALTRIESEAVSLNAVPQRCSLYLDLRLILGQDMDYLSEEMAKLLEGTEARWQIHESVGLAWTGKEVRLHCFLPAWEIGLDHPLTQALMQADQDAFGELPITRTWDFSTNGVATARLGIPTIGFGPGNDKLAHMRDEYCYVSEIPDAALVYARLIQKL